MISWGLHKGSISTESMDHMSMLPSLIDYCQCVGIVCQRVGIGDRCRGHLERGERELVDFLTLHCDHIGRGERKDSGGVLGRSSQDRLLLATCSREN